MGALARNRRAWRLWSAVHVLLVDQVELQLKGGTDGQAQLVEPANHLAQHFARVGEERRAVALTLMHTVYIGDLLVYLLALRLLLENCIRFIELNATRRRLHDELP